MVGGDGSAGRWRALAAVLVREAEPAGTSVLLLSRAVQAASADRPERVERAEFSFGPGRVMALKGIAEEQTVHSLER